MTQGELNRMINEFYNLNEKSKQSIESYLGVMMKVNSAQRTYNSNKKNQERLEKRIGQINAEIAKNGNKVTSEQAKQLAIAKQGLTIIKQQNIGLQATINAHKSTNKLLNLGLATINTTERTIFRLGKALVKNSGYYLDQMRSVRETERSMGQLKSQTDSFRKTLYSASVQTNRIGVDTKMLAQMQGEYSDSIGRSVLLNEDSLTQMALLHKSTGQSLTNVSDLVSLTDGMGLNIVEAVDHFDDLSDKAIHMGINQTKTLGQMNNILKLANKYSFKNGVESMKQMAIQSTRFKSDISEIASLSDRLFDVEGAIKMGAELQVLGGKWAQIADPMNLLFKARNDMAGLQQDIIKASSESAQWDETTKSFKITSLELHRMRGIAEATGLSMENLKNMAEQTARVNFVKSKISNIGLTEEEMDWVASTANLDGKGGFNLRLNGEEINSKDLYRYANEITKTLKEVETMTDKADRAMIFDEKFTNIINSLKSTALPIFEKLDKVLTPVFKSLDKVLDDGKVLNQIERTMGAVASGIGLLAEFVVKNPMTSLLSAGIAVGARALFEVYQWKLMGMQLGRGFLQMTSSKVGGSGSGGMNPFGKTPKGLRRGVGIGALAGVGLDMFQQSDMVEQGSDLQKGMNVGAKALEWGSTGALIGSMFAPVLGTIIGGALGAIGGGIYGHVQNQKDSDMANDFIARPGEKPIKFNSADTLVGLKKDGGIGRALLDKGTTNNSITKVSFDKPLIIQGSIELKGNNSTIGSLDLKDPILQRELSRLVQEQLSINLSGGKRTNNNL